LSLHIGREKYITTSLLVVFAVSNRYGANSKNYRLIASAKSPSPGRREGDGRGDKGEVSGGRRPRYT